MYLLYFVLWIIFNGSFTLEIAIFGVLIATALFVFSCKFADYSLQKEKLLYKNIGWLLKYVAVLIVEIVKANFAVIHLILTQKEEPEPLLITFDLDIESPIEKSIMANTITLTPGTITVLLEGKEYTVHCLDESFADGIDETKFSEILKEIEKK